MANFDSMLNGIFSPLGGNNCVVFQVISMIGLLLALILIIIGIFNIKKKNGLLSAVLAAVSPLIMYYLYRLFYSVCVGSTQPR
tara:strand:+ start:3287 stop:3535 length:249 start_codon:yes stop_codon:yes gene_type:complete